MQDCTGQEQCTNVQMSSNREYLPGNIMHKRTRYAEGGSMAHWGTGSSTHIQVTGTSWPGQLCLSVLHRDIVINDNNFMHACT